MAAGRWSLCHQHVCGSSWHKQPSRQRFNPVLGIAWYINYYTVFNIQYPRFGDKPKCMSALVGAVVVTGPGLQASTIVLVVLPVF